MGIPADDIGTTTIEDHEKVAFRCKLLLHHQEYHHHLREPLEDDLLAQPRFQHLKEIDQLDLKLLGTTMSEQ